MEPNDATIRQMTAESRERDAYWRGTQDGALSALAPALGVPGPVQHQLMGRPFRLTIEWLDDDFEDPRYEEVARRMAADAAQRVAQVGSR